MPRASIVPSARVVADPVAQVRALFRPDWDARQVVLVDREGVRPGSDGGQTGVRPGSDAGLTPSIDVDRSNRVVVRAAAPAGGGYLLLLDSYSEDWRVTVDGHAATLLRANGLFRAVRLTEGSHVVDFVYRPRAFLWGAGVSAVALLCLLALCVPRSVDRGQGQPPRSAR